MRGYGILLLGRQSQFLWPPGPYEYYYDYNNNNNVFYTNIVTLGSWQNPA